MSEVQTTQSPFDSICHNEDDREYWSARELMPLLEYKDWRRFGSRGSKKRLSVIQKAMLACKNSGVSTDANFARVGKHSARSNGIGYTVEDWELSRYACYLVAMNGDPSKIAISEAQTYFAIKTRQAEVAEVKVIESEPEKPPLTAEEISNVYDLVFKETGVDPKLSAGAKLNALTEFDPRLTPLLEPARTILNESTASKEKLFTPTQIGKELRISAIKVNKLLIKAGMQKENPDRKNSKKEPTYLPTLEGEEHSIFILATGKRKDNTTYQILRWYESVITIVQKANEEK